MAKKDKDAKSTEVVRLENEARKINNKLAKARTADYEKRTLGALRDSVKDAEERFGDLIDRQTSYDTNEKMRVFGFGAFDGGLDGSLRWVRMNSVYSVEVELPHVDSTNQKVITMLKTVDGPVDVSQSPSEVADEFVRVRFAYESEQVREMQSEQLRRENKIAERKQKAKDKATKAKPASRAKSDGPDFGAVSRAVNGEDSGDEDLLFFDDDADDAGDPQ